VYVAGKWKEKVDFSPDFVDAQKLDFLTGEKRILLVAFSPQTVDFCAKSGFGMTTFAARVQPIAIRSWGLRVAALLRLEAD
jgi:hypothetical protein